MHHADTQMHLRLRIKNRYGVDTSGPSFWFLYVFF
jgi:hypothetical protein